MIPINKAKVVPSWKAVYLQVSASSLRGWLKVLWGADIWIGPVPMMKAWLVVFVVAGFLVGWLS